MTDFLRSMAASSAARAAAARAGVREAGADRPVARLVLGDFDVIAEIKDRSPSEGDLATPRLDRRDRARLYAEGGAAAISVLTEPTRFGGALEHLEDVAAAVPGVPVMRKDFLVDPVQILEARSAGASGVLLIAAMLDDNALADMLACAAEHEMFVLLEAFDETDLLRTGKVLRVARNAERAAAGDILVGVNTRNLRTLEVDPKRLASLAPLLPGARCVAESGLVTAEDAAQAARLGYRLALVGSALMKSGDPAALVSDMLRAGRSRVAA